MGEQRTLDFRHDGCDVSIPVPYTPIYACYRGSLAHGTYISPRDPASIDDVDVFCVSIATKAHYFGLERWEGENFWQDEFDVVAYDLRKFVRLLAKGNPTCLGLLFTDNRHVLLCSFTGEQLRERRHLFLAKRSVYESFCGYARSQLKRMTHIANGKTPTQAYMGQKRKALVERYGYDTKNAAHLIRLLHMCREFLQHNTLFVDRRNIDAGLLMSIKKGEWALVQVESYAHTLFAEIEYRYDACTCPEFMDMSAINNLLVDILGEFYACCR